MAANRVSLFLFHLPDMEYPEERSQCRDHGREDEQWHIPPLSSHCPFHNPASCNSRYRVWHLKSGTENSKIGSDEGKPVIQVLELVVIDALHHFKPG